MTEVDRKREIESLLDELFRLQRENRKLREVAEAVVRLGKEVLYGAR